MILSCSGPRQMDAHAGDRPATRGEHGQPDTSKLRQGGGESAGRDTGQKKCSGRGASERARPRARKGKGKGVERERQRKGQAPPEAGKGKGNPAAVLPGFFSFSSPLWRLAAIGFSFSSESFVFVSLSDFLFLGLPLALPFPFARAGFFFLACWRCLFLPRHFAAADGWAVRAPRRRRVAGVVVHLVPPRTGENHVEDREKVVSHRVACRVVWVHSAAWVCGGHAGWHGVPAWCQGIRQRVPARVR